tara:strand:- start:110309 stop:111421 length:1113 start_codon:yes stop_codon:yes gene_type:complete
MVKAFEIGKWYRVKKPAEEAAPAPSRVRWENDYDDYDGKVLQCRYVFFNKIHGFLGASRLFGFHASWVEGPFDSKEEAEKLGNFVGAHWDSMNQTGYHAYKNELGVVTEIKQPTAAEQVSYLTATAKKEIFDTRDNFRDRMLQAGVGIPDHYIDQIANHKKPKIWKSTVPYDGSKKIVMVSSVSESSALQRKVDDMLTGLRQTSKSQREIQRRLDSLELKNLTDMGRVTKIIEDRLNKFEGQNFNSAFQGKDGKLYCVTSDKGLFVYDDEAGAGSWSLMMPSDSLSSTEKMKVEMKRIDEEADRDIDNIIENYNKRRAADRKHSEKLRKNFDNNKTVPVKKKSLPLWLAVGLGSISATAATLGTVFYWLF